MNMETKLKLKIQRETEILKSLDEYYMEYFEYDLSINKESTAYDHKNNYFKHVSPILGKYKPSEINMNSIDKFHLEIDKKELSHNTKININSSLSSFLEYLKLKSKIELNYAKAYGTFKQVNNNIIEEKK